MNTNSSREVAIANRTSQGSKIKVVVTGTSGFIGKNLVSHLRILDHLDLIEIDRLAANSSSFAEILPALKCGDIVFHLAAVNRATTVEEFRAGNEGLTNRICNILESTDSQPTIVYSSSTKATENNLYGKSKSLTEKRLIEHRQRTGADVYLYRLPNVFGKWSRPNYNSAVATFCHNIANNQSIMIRDAEAPITLLYIDDLCQHWLEHLSGSAIDCDKNRIAALPKCFNTTVGEVAGHIQAIRDSRENRITEPVGSGLPRALHATYLSFLKPDQFCYSLTPRGDQRGSFVEFLKTNDNGQISVFTSKPGETRGGHYHHTKSEKFLVVQGRALFRFHNIANEQCHQTIVDAAQFKVVETIPGWAHDLKNIGDETLICVLWANECFDPDEPDTYSHPVRRG